MCREWFPYQKKLRSLHTDYDDCPLICGFSKPKINANRTSLCDKCPKTRLRNEYQRSVERLWETWLGSEIADTKDFNTEWQTFVSVLMSKQQKRMKRDVLAERFIEIYESEKDRFDRKERETKAAS